MKLWVVTRRAPLAKGDRKVYVWRTIVMSETESSAVEIAKGDVDASTSEGERYHALYLSGTWSAREVDPPCKFEIGCYSTEPTDDDKAQRAGRSAVKL